MGFVLLVPAPGADSQLLVRSTGAEWWQGKETQITLEINNDFSYIKYFFCSTKHCKQMLYSLLLFLKKKKSVGWGFYW